LILLKIVVLDGAPRSYSQLACELGMSASEVHAGLKRAASGGLMRLTHDWGAPDCAALEEFLVHGVKYAFAPARGGLALGIPTSFAAPPLVAISAASRDPLPVWPHPSGSVHGVAFAPLYKSVPVAAVRDPRLYELLALVDALRGAPSAVREIAARELHVRLSERPEAKIIPLRQSKLAGEAAPHAAGLQAQRGTDG